MEELCKGTGEFRSFLHSTIFCGPVLFLRKWFQDTSHFKDVYETHSSHIACIVHPLDYAVCDEMLYQCITNEYLGVFAYLDGVDPVARWVEIGPCNEHSYAVPKIRIRINELENSEYVRANGNTARAVLETLFVGEPEGEQGVEQEEEKDNQV